jgi:hypothetical protein
MEKLIEQKKEERNTLQAAEEMAAMALVSFTLTEREDTRGDNSDTGAAVRTAATRRCRGSPLLNARLDRNIAPPFLRRSDVVAPQPSSQIAQRRKQYYGE